MSLRGAILQIKRKKAPFFIKKNDYKGMKTINKTCKICGNIFIANTNRTAYVNEIDPHYCDVIRKRWTKWAEENGVNAGSGALR